MDNVITITLKDAVALKDGQKNIHRIEFESDPSLSELVAAKLVIEEVLEHNFNKQEIILKEGIIYPRLQDLEEIRRRED